MEIGQKTALYHKLVFEVRYEQGLVYLDRCGTTANRIMKIDPNWVLQDESVNPQNAPLVHLLSGTHFNFGSLKYDFSLDQPVNRDTALTQSDIEQFVSQVERVAQVVHDELELKIFMREGFRVWFLFGTDSEEESQEWISRLGVFHVAPQLPSAFNGRLESEGHVALIGSGDRKHRVAVNAVERLEQIDLGDQALKVLPRKLPRGQREAVLAQLQAKKRVLANPQFAVMIDVDTYVDQPIDVEPGDFIRQSLTNVEQFLPLALSGGGQ